MTPQPLPTVALSILQPWAWLIVNGYKDIENRTWRTHRRGPILVHTGKGFDSDAHQDMLQGVHPCYDLGHLKADVHDAYRLAWEAGEIHRGGIVGGCRITGCVTDHPSWWFAGPFGFTLADQMPLPFMPLSGARGFFPATYIPPANC
ncbi:ASCH domain-containing protein [Caulobacter vibrioides]|uniref:ASCH domain-containing protein n=1 Tax=Caulobacter vibrioides TaxID=155892 RepID=A0A290MQ60_CAUVI|nr:ASCH domain-containing protein [Caulobacter vibrioides]ATC34130.1 ASCH domain-containing protein [Caulobacter vibrioides]